MKLTKTLFVVATATLCAAVWQLSAEEGDPALPGLFERERPLQNLRDFNERIRRAAADLDLSDDLRAEIDAYRETQTALREALQEQLRGLETRDRESIAEVTRQFREQNQDLIDAQRDAAASIREQLAEFRMENAPERPIPPAEVREARRELNQARVAMNDQRRQMRERLQAAQTAEERRAIVTEFREEQKALVREMIQLRRNLREEMRGRHGGDRRVGGEG